MAKPKKRGPKPSPDSARVTLGVRMSKAEKEAIEDAAEKDGQTASAWARERILLALRDRGG
jgi:hypothetical protein